MPLRFLPHPVPHLLFALSIAYLALLISNVIPLYARSSFDGGLRRVLDQLRHAVLNNSMIQVHRDWKKRRRLAARRPWRILLKVIVPLIKPGLIYTWI